MKEVDISVGLKEEMLGGVLTSRTQFNSFFESVQWMWDKLTDEERMELPRCHGCGTTNVNCQCWNDE